MTFSPMAVLVCVCVCVCVGGEAGSLGAANEDRDIHDNYQLKLSEPQCFPGFDSLLAQPLIFLYMSCGAIRAWWVWLDRNYLTCPLSFPPLSIYRQHCVRECSGKHSTHQAHMVSGKSATATN